MRPIYWEIDRDDDVRMSVRSLERNLGQRLAFAGSWRPREPAERRLVDAACRVLEAARTLERAGGAPRSARATHPSLGCLAAAFESLANATLMIRGAATAGFKGAAQTTEQAGNLEQLGRLLFTVDQNLRFASHACELSLAALESIPDPP